MNVEIDKKALRPSEIEKPKDYVSIGSWRSRYDGPAKVTGAAHYPADTQGDREGLVYAELVQSTIACGRIESIDVSAAEKVEGVLEILTHENWPGFQEWPEKFPVGPMGVSKDPLSSGEISQHGQIVGVVVAETLEAARHAVDLIRIEYDRAEPMRPFGDGSEDLAEPEAVGKQQKDGMDRGDPEGDYERSEVKLDLAYVTARQTHNQMEPHSVVAEWEGEDRLVVDEPTQHVTGNRAGLARLFGLKPENVRVRSAYVGGAFGGKTTLWANVPIAALCARRLKRPVKLVLEREQMFTTVGYRPATRQEIKIAGSKDGRISTFMEKGVSQMAMEDIFAETTEGPPSMLYDFRNFKYRQYFRKTNTVAPIMMRAPGEATGSFGLECAMDEFAYAVGMDPLELRILNHADTDPSNGKPWSSKSLLECYEVAAGAFGWRERDPQPRSMRENGQFVGFGMASSTYPVMVAPATARLRIEPDGSATVIAGTHDLGTGTYTILQQLAADALALEPEQVKVMIGDSDFPPNIPSGGSNTAASLSQAVMAAASEARDALIGLALQDPSSPLHGLTADQVTLNSGILTGRGGRQERVSHLIERRGGAAVTGEGRTLPVGQEQKHWEKAAKGDLVMQNTTPEHSTHSFGAQFVEVHVDEMVKTIKVKRMTAAFGVGRVLNRKTARSQLIGGMVLGIGTALHEESITDPATHMLTNANLADYLIATNADVPPIDIHFVDEDDRYINALGVKGVGEIGVVGTSAAIANAVFHATGKRLRHIPMRLEKLLD